MLDHTAQVPISGHCHRYPPGVFANPETGTIVQKFPSTDRIQCCGEWSDDEAEMVEKAHRCTLRHARSIASGTPGSGHA